VFSIILAFFFGVFYSRRIRRKRMNIVEILD
jgi:hypothetical protein